jgi:integrase/recombinase XerD
MPRKGDCMERPSYGDPNDPQGLVFLMHQHLEWLRVHNYSEKTVQSREFHLVQFIQWAGQRGLVRPNEVTKPILERYQRSLYQHRKANGEPLSFGSQVQKLRPVRTWFKWLTRQNHLLYNPASELEMPKLEFRLPKHVLTASEAEEVLRQPNLSDPLGIRDRAILETFYSTGIRRSELCHLNLYDVDVDRGTVIVRQGKGKKDRMIPIGERALLWINRYLLEVRPRLLLGAGSDTLFLNHDGTTMTPEYLSILVKQYVNAAAIGKKGSCHLFRHTMATLMLENGADIRFIQAMLGHAKLTTTQIYTQVSIRQLKAVHEATHPAKMERQQGRDDPDDKA